MSITLSYSSTYPTKDQIRELYGCRSKCLDDLMSFLVHAFKINTVEDIRTFAKDLYSIDPGYFTNDSAIGMDVLEAFWTKYLSKYKISLWKLIIVKEFEDDYLISRRVDEASHHYIGSGQLIEDFYIVLRFWKVNGEVNYDQGHYLLFSCQPNTSKQVQFVPMIFMVKAFSEQNGTFLIDLES